MIYLVCLMGSYLVVKEARQISSVIDDQLVVALTNGACNRIVAYFASTSNLLGDCKLVYSAFYIFNVVQSVNTWIQLQLEAIESVLH